MALPTKTMRSALTAAGVAAVTGGILLLSGVQREISGGVAGIAGIAAGVFKRRKSKIVREVSENNEEVTEGEGLYGLAVSEFEAGNYANAVGLFSQALELNEESAEVYHLRGYSWGELGQWSEQIEDYSRAIEMGGIDDDLYFSRGVAYFNAELYESAISDFTRSLESRPENTTGALINRGSAFFYLHKHKEARMDFTKALEIETDNADAYYNRARANQESGDLESAISDFNRAIELNEKNFDYLIDRGIAWGQKDESEKAINDFNEALRIDPDSERAEWLRARMLQLDDFEKTESTIEQSDVQLSNNACNIVSIHTFTLEGDQRFSAGEFRDAVAAYTKAIELCASDEGAHLFFNRALSKEMLSDYTGAILDYDKALEISPDDEAALNNRGIIKRRTGDLKGSISDYTRAIEINPSVSTYHFNRGNARIDLGDQLSAIVDYKTAIEIDPSKDNYFLNLGLAMQAVGDQEGCIEKFRTAIGINSNNLHAYMAMADAFFALGDHRSALSHYGAAISINPNIAETHYNHGSSNLMLGDYESAIRDYSTAIDINPVDADSYRKRSDCRFKLGDIGGAVTDLDKSLEIDPHSAYAYQRRGLARYNLGDYGAALEDFSTAIQEDPKHPLSYGLRAMTMKAVGDITESVRDYRHAIELEPGNAFTHFAISKVYCLGDFASEVIDSITTALRLGLEEQYLREAVVNRSKAYFSLGRYRECLTDIDTFFSLPANGTLSALEANLIATRAECRRQLQDDLQAALSDAKHAVDLDRNSITLNDLGNIQQDLGMIDEAIASFTEAICLAPEDAFIITNRANAKILKGDADGALEDYTLAIESGELTAFYNRGNLRLNQLNDYEGAIKDFTSAISCDDCTEKHWYYFNRAYSNVLKGNLAEALEDCDRALAIAPDYIRPIRQKAKIYYKLGELSQAKECYLKILEQGGADFVDYSDLGSIENQLNNHELAATYLEQSIRLNRDNTDNPSDKDALVNSSYYLAHSLWRLGDYQKAISVTVRCGQYCELNAEFLRLTACIYDDSGDSKKAIETINKALALDGTIPAIWYDRGVIKRDSGDLEGAIADFKQAFALDSSFTSACHNIGSSYMKTGNMTQACYYWKMASDLGDQDSKRLVDEYCGEE